MKVHRLQGIKLVVGFVLLSVLILPVYLLIGFLSGIVPPGLAVALGLIVLAGATILLTPPLSNKLNRR